MEIINYVWDLYLVCIVQFGPGAHPASYTMGTGGSFSEIKQSGCGIDHSFSAKVASG
jgi:hypothetical protein